MIIQNYGLHWKREEVNWGWKGEGNKGTLMGREAEKVRSPHVNFRRQAGIYILQEGFRSVYVGQTGKGDGKLFQRLRHHTRHQLAERWDRFSWFGIYPVIEYAEEGEKLWGVDESFKLRQIEIPEILDHLEGALISVTEPPLNRQGARFGKALQYKQIGLDIEDEEELDAE